MTVQLSPHTAESLVYVERGPWGEVALYVAERAFHLEVVTSDWSTHRAYDRWDAAKAAYERSIERNQVTRTVDDRAGADRTTGDRTRDTAAA